MLKCKQVVDLASESFETKLPWSKRWQMKLHLLMCKTCQRYFEQLRFIQKAITTIDNEYRKTTLSTNARKRIQNKIKTTPGYPDVPPKSDDSGSRIP